MKDLILGNHLLFAREGDTIDSITVSSTAKPDNDPTNNWLKLPTVEAFEPRSERTFVDRRAPSPGRYQTRRRIPISQRLTLNFSLQEWTEMTFAEMLLGGTRPAMGIFEPNGTGESVRGWWQIQSFDQLNTPILVMDVWGEATIETYRFGENLDPYALVLEVLYSPLNVGEILNME